jgi:hypothetical protein
MITPYIQAITVRRTQQLALTESYLLAVKASSFSGGDDGVLLRLRDVTKLLLADCESIGAQLAEVSQEPAYHSRQHLADVLLSMGYFLQKTNFNDYQKQLLLLVMLVHDFGHRGIANKLPDLSHELESIALLKATPLKGLPPEDIFFIEECILGTMPENVSKVAETFVLNPLDSFALMRALVNDADIAASFVPSLGLELSKQILLEKGVSAPSEQESRDAYTAFKSQTRITTPVARKLLGLDSGN